MNALIFSGGVFSGLPDNIKLGEFDIIASCDKGYMYAESVGVVPDIFVGDFDSIPKEIEVKSPEIIKLKTQKDMTDTEEAVSILISRGVKEIVILGALGGVISHELANIFLLKLGLEKGVKITLVDKENELMLIDSHAKIPERDGFNLSLIPMTECKNVSISGVFYPLCRACLSPGTTLGISNEFTDDLAEITIEEGLLLVAICKK